MVGESVTNTTDGSHVYERTADNDRPVYLSPRGRPRV